MKKRTRSFVTLVMFVFYLGSGLPHRSAQAQTVPTGASGVARQAAGSTVRAQTTPGANAGQSNAQTSIVLLVSGSGTNKIYAYDVVSGNTLYNLGGDNDPIRNPQGMAVGPDGLLYVASNGTNKILRYDLNSKQMKDVLTDCTGCRQFQFAANGDPLVLVGNYYNSTIDRYSNGKLTPFLTAAQPSGALDMIHGPDGWLYVADGRIVHRYNPATGEDSRDFIPAGQANLGSPNGLAFGPDGNLYISDSRNNTIVEYSPEGQYLKYFISDTRLASPGRLRFGPDGNLYVINGRSGEVLEFQGPNGTAPATLVRVAVQAGQGGLRGPTYLSFLTPEPALGSPYGSIASASSSIQGAPGTNRAPVASTAPGSVAGAQSPIIGAPITGIPGALPAQTGNPVPTPASTVTTPVTKPGTTKTATPAGTNPVKPAVGAKAGTTATTKRLHIPPAPRPAPPAKPAAPSAPPAPKH